MVSESNWQEMKRQAFDVYHREGRMSVPALEKIVDIGCADGKFDEDEKVVLINIISSLTRADMNDAMWDKIDELIHKFELAQDTGASIEYLDAEEDDHH
jgi:tellurite resistance protein